MRIPCRIPLASKSGHRTLHVTTSSLTRSTPHPVSTKYPKTSTSTIPKPLPYKSPVGAHTQKPATAIEQPTDTAISSNTPSNTEQPSLSSTNASASSLPTSSPRQGSIEAGRRATEEVIRTGKLPEKYKGASRRYESSLILLVTRVKLNGGCFGAELRPSLLLCLY